MAQENEEETVDDNFDVAPYLRTPPVDLDSGVALGIALLNAMIQPSPDNVRALAIKLRKSVVSLQAAWAKSEVEGVALDRRKVDVRIDHAWNILLDRLQAYALLSVTKNPRAPRARELLDTLSPKDRKWLKLAYEDEWAESKKRLEQIESEGLAKDINEIAGPEFLAEVKAAHAEYGVALALTAPAGVNLSAPLHALATAIHNYSFAVVGMAINRSTPFSAIHNALRPFDAHLDVQERRARAGGVGTEALLAAATTPVPEVK